MSDQGPETEAEHIEPEAPERETRTLYRHWMAALGGSLMLAGFLVFVILLIVDFTSGIDNPYRSIVGFIGAPIIGFIGLVFFLISIRVQVLQARRRGEVVRFRLNIVPSDPRYMRSLWLFLGLTAAFVVVFAYAGFKGYETTDSAAFCGESCHEVMGPENVTYHNSPHARVPCVDCHIGPGAGFWVQSKIDGIRQVLAVATDSFERPIPTPVESLRPAQQTCEECHWPEQFFGQKLVTHNYYRTDEGNTPWTISLLVNIGGGNPRTGALEGIHWHMATTNVVEYIATDTDRQHIPWFRVTAADGTVTTYADPAAEYPDPGAEDTEIRTFDCMDCHNRPSHDFTPPAVSMNLALSTGKISRDLPFIRKLGVDLLNAAYVTTSQANASIAAGLQDFYQTNYAGEFDELAAKISQAEETLLSVYDSNFFPEMNTDYRS
ncbi:MAG: NapC/NirT family cytochrome c, partial [Acidimicrobiia bacterium]|nr:NapC/NirT family cytochrome c [Acidimicrobiia bacterium]